MVAVPRRCTPVIIGPGVQIKARIKRAARMNIEWTDLGWMDGWRPARHSGRRALIS